MDQSHAVLENRVRVSYDSLCEFGFRALWKRKARDNRHPFGIPCYTFMSQKDTNCNSYQTFGIDADVCYIFSQPHMYIQQCVLSMPALV